MFAVGSLMLAVCCPGSTLCNADVGLRFAYISRELPQVGLVLAYVGPMLVLCWPYIGPILALCCSIITTNFVALY